jgi:hypothetical protein
MNVIGAMLPEPAGNFNRPGGELEEEADISLPLAALEPR